MADVESEKEELERLRLKEKVNHEMLRDHFYQCEFCGGMGRDLSKKPFVTCVECEGSGFICPKPKS